MLSQEERIIYERMQIPFVLFEVDDGKCRAVLISDGLCGVGNKEREVFLEQLNTDIYNQVHPDDVEWMKRDIESFFHKMNNFDVVFRNRINNLGGYRMVHPISNFSHQQISASLVGGPLRLPITLIYTSCIAGLVFISHFVKWKIYSLSPSETISYIIICVVGFFFGQYIVSITLESFEQFADISFTNKLIIISSIYCILFLILLTYIYILNCTKEVNRKLLEDKQQLLLEEANYKNLIKTTDSLRKLKHDMQHHLSTIQYYAQHNNTKELIDYVSKYMGALNNMHKFISTGNSAIDCILSISISKAEAKGIDVSYTLTVPDTFNLDPILTSSLLGNLWINAIEASEKLIAVNKSAAIDFYIKPFENMLLISIENSYDGFYKKNSNGIFISTKSGANNGIGLKRINEIVKQNDGILEITNTENLFCVHIMFPLEEKNSYENCDSRR